MTQINPLLGSVLQTSDVQRQQSDDKDRLLRKTTDKRKNAGLSGDRFEHAVESAEAVAPIHDEQNNDPKKKQDQHRHAHDAQGEDDSESHLDMTA